MDGRSKEAVDNEERGRVSHSQPDIEKVSFRLLSNVALDSDALLRIKTRLHRSIDDPRSSLTLDQVDEFIDALVAKARTDAGRA